MIYLECSKNYLARIMNRNFIPIFVKILNIDR